MSACPFLTACPFFNDRLATMPSVSGYLKSQLCNGKFEQCARYSVRTQLDSQHVPPDMFPNEHLRAQEIIARSKIV